MARVSRALKTSAEVALEGHGVHAGQQFILERLWEREGQTVGELAEAVGVEGPTAVRAVQRMEAAGLVRRRDHPTDGRQVAIHLTKEGSRLRKELPRVLDQVEERALKGLSSAERHHLLQLLERLGANVRSRPARRSRPPRMSRRGGSKGGPTGSPTRCSRAPPSG